MKTTALMIAGVIGLSTAAIAQTTPQTSTPQTTPQTMPPSTTTTVPAPADPNMPSGAPRPTMPTETPTTTESDTATIPPAGDEALANETAPPPQH